MSSTHNHCFSHHHYQAWCHQIFFVNNTKNICNFFSFEATEMVLKSKWGRTQPEIQPSSDREQDVSRKPLEVSRNALRAEITYDPLVAHNAFIYDTTNNFN